MGHYFLDIYYTVCPRSSDPFYGGTYYIKWVTTSWTYSSKQENSGSKCLTNVSCSLINYTHTHTNSLDNF